eukprot:gnl/MRDRNA2_/MRDRNA2_21128_c0_seq1.p1 gnl/MRDRNA2_/MRDRNA2_21128_c0~~gnl/MRDRNA2_/MRDRNA2_21128_c0_seq1.p1  ORF type:complete len:358 (+),score=50.90 gnl/MRDRNA2_/MRDRNA2_21128_c0_seq1:125-1075(+)
MPPKLANVWFPDHQRPIADAFGSVSASIGAAVGFLMPTAIMNGDGSMIGTVMIVEAAAVSGMFLVAWLFFENLPPSPPSLGASSSKEDHHSSPDRSGVLDEALEALRDRDFCCAMLAFSSGLGTFNVLGTMIEQITKPFHFSENDASNFGALVVVMGLVGAVFCGIWLGCSHAFRCTLTSCFAGATFAACGLALVVPLGPDATNCTYVVMSLLGMTMTPVMPVAFEASVELMQPVVGEAVLSGLCMAGGQVVGICMTLLLSWLCMHGRPDAALWAIVFGIFLGLVAICFFRDESLGVRRRNHERSQRKKGSTHSTP